MTPLTIRTEAFARAGLVGNPSDGYFGKTISFIIRNFSARVELREADTIEIMPNERDHSTFDSIDELVQDVALHGYYGGVRLLKATVKRFFDACRERGIELHGRCFRLSYHSTIPGRVGMAGSSAIITACLRALMKFYGVTEEQLCKPKIPNLILAVETEELGIPAGLQDRVIQVFEGVVFMDFDEAMMQKLGHGIYEELDPSLLPRMYVAFQAGFGEGTEVPHSDLRKRWIAGEPAVRDAMQEWAAIAQKTRELLMAGKGGEIGPVLNANFDLRRRICGNTLNPHHVRMVEAARAIGCSAKYTGSGGAIVGTYEDERMFFTLCEALRPLGVTVFKPQIVPPGALP